MRMPVEMEKKYIRDNRDKIVAYPVGHLPIIKEFSTKLGIVEVINQMVPSQMMESPGTVFLGLIMDTLSGRSPLYRLDDFFNNQDTELLLGNKVQTYRRANFTDNSHKKIFKIQGAPGYKNFAYYQIEESLFHTSI